MGVTTSWSNKAPRSAGGRYSPPLVAQSGGGLGRGLSLMGVAGRERTGYPVVYDERSTNARSCGRRRCD